MYKSTSLTSALFFSRYFFLVLIALVGIGLVNGLFFFPVMLSLVGPRGEVVPLSHPDRISTPSPEPVRRSRAPKCRVAPPPRRHTPTHACHREPSLTTITEEPSWHSQHEPETTQTIVVEPEFVVETTTCSHPHVSIYPLQAKLIYRLQQQLIHITVYWWPYFSSQLYTLLL